MFRIFRRRALVQAALCVVVMLGACMPARVEVGRDSTLDVVTPGAAGTLGTSGASGADGGESGAFCGSEATCAP